MSRLKALLKLLLPKPRKMATTPHRSQEHTGTSLSARTATPTLAGQPSKPPQTTAGLTHPPNPAPPQSAPCTVHELHIPVPDHAGGTVFGLLHLPANFTPTPTPTPTSPRTVTAAILVSGAGGGLMGPSSIYLTLATKLTTTTTFPPPHPSIPSIPTLRLSYRFPARTHPCTADVLAAMNFLASTYPGVITRFVLVGWSFGGAPVFTVAGADGRVVGCATVASQTAGTEGIRGLPPRPVLLVHGTADRTLGWGCSERLYEMYGGGEGERRLVLLEGDDHCLSKGAERAEELLWAFVVKCAGGEVGGGEEVEGLVKGELMGKEERREGMRRGGDLRGGEGEE